MKIALVQCPAWTTESPTYGLALLTAALKKRGHEVLCFDFNIELYRFCKEQQNQHRSVINEESWSMDFRGSVWYEKDSVLNFINRFEVYIDGLVELVVRSPVQIIGFSVQSTSKFFSLEFARRIKEKDKNKTIVFGGHLCFRNCYGINMLKDFQFLDFVCFGEAEESFPDLVGRLEKNEHIESYAGFGHCLKDGTIIDGGDGELIENLDEKPFADYSIFCLEKYTKSLLPISTSRGCINRCSFCNESPHWGRYRRRSAQNILAEIMYQIEKYPHIEMFWFNDSLINGDIKMLNELCDLLISNKIRINWGGQGIICNEMKREFLQKMKLAGCSVISYGVESGSTKLLRLMQKKYTAELSEEVIRNTFKTGISVIFNIIVGFPSETENEFKKTRDFIRHCRKYASHIELVSLLLLKDSYLYNNLEKFNIAPMESNDSDWQLKWKTNDNLNTYSIRKQRLEELKKIMEEAF
ncbi:MAG: radical SAM protein [Candidatus Omnitrophota bacterium]